MTLKLYETVNHDGLFDLLGPGFYALSVMDQAQAQDVPDAIDDFLTAIDTAESNELDYLTTLQFTSQAELAYQSGTAGAASTLTAGLAAILDRFIVDDSLRASGDLTANLEYLIAAMLAGSYKVTANAVAATAAAGGSNIGDVTLIASEKRGDGQDVQTIRAETVTVTVSGGSDARPQLQFTGQAAAPSSMAYTWPAGSGCSVSITAADPTADGGIVSNGSFEDEDASVSGLPDGWIDCAGTGTVTMTANPVQTLAITGSPAGGWFAVGWEAPSGATYSTLPLAYNATAATVQAALRTIPGLEAVTVATTGTAPNLTHTVTCYGARGDIETFTVSTHLTGGTGPVVTAAQPTHGNANSYRGRSLVLTSGAEASVIVGQPIALDSDTVYGVQIRLRVSESLGSGALALTLKSNADGTGDTLEDSAGNAQTLTVDLDTLTPSTNYVLSGTFRVSAAAPPVIYLTIVSTAANGKAVYIDDLCITPATELYPGGPWVAAISSSDAATVADSWTVTTTNDYAGELQAWTDRCFDLAGKRLQLPTVGTTLIPDSLAEEPPA